MARIQSVSCHGLTPLCSGWELLRTPANAATSPEAAETLGGHWIPAQVPGTVASALRAAGRWDVDHLPDFDAEDVWYRLRFPRPSGDAARSQLRFEGLATVAEVWLNGVRRLSSQSMWHAHRLDVGAWLRGENVLYLRFCALTPLLAQKRPRPRWKARLVAQQQLRWWRTSLLGRIPAWTPAVAPVGPFRPVVLEQQQGLEVLEAVVRPRLTGDAGTVEVRLHARALSSGRLPPARLHLGAAEAPLELAHLPDGTGVWEGRVTLPAVERWWPHTHGPPSLHPLRIEVQGMASVVFPPVGFRTVDVDTADGGFTLRVNGERIFCRGACWTPLDVVSLGASPEVTRAALEQVRDAGMNMVRVSGTMVYEDDAFHDLCDALGILVWQDFMFANLDYPAEDARFAETVTAEARAVVSRLGARPSTAIFCGNSEVEQQAAMLGLPADAWRNDLFAVLLPSVVRAACDVPYLPSTPSGGVLPFQANQGVAHYFGVGAYQRPLEDARRADVRFAAECLAFSNVPDARTVDALVVDGERAPTDPRWKARVARDRGNGWDFEDVRDLYLARLFGVDPVVLRYADPERYLALGRTTTAEVMAATFAEWRRHGSRCAGGLVWFLRDLWPGAGWGIVDALGRPKAAYWALRRILAPLALAITDEGTNGLALHLINDRSEAVAGNLRVTLYRDGQHVVASGARRVEVPGRGSLQLWAEDLLEHFADVGYAFRFGPPGHDLVVAAWTDPAGSPLAAPAFHHPLGRPSCIDPAITVGVTCASEGRGRYRVALLSQRFAQSVSVRVEGFLVDDDFFHLEPGVVHTLHLRDLGVAHELLGTVQPLNGAVATRFGGPA